jgi:hypothetical protein
MAYFKNPFADANGRVGPPREDNTVLLTPKMFLGEDHHPYFTKEKWLTYGKSLRPSEVKDLGKLFQCISEGLRMEGNPLLRSDVGERPYIYHRFLKPRASVGVKIIMEGGMEAFIADYQNGNFKMNFTLEELTEEAKTT